MVYVSARALEEELRHLEEELAAARNLEHSTAERHAEEGSQETEAVLEARKIQAEHLEAEREGLVAELRRRAVAEAGWEHDAAGGGAGPDGAPVRSAGCGRAGKLRIGPHLLLPERGYLLHDRSEGTVAWVRGVPSPSRASEILAEHGVEWEGELLSHTLSPVPEGAEGP